MDHFGLIIKFIDFIPHNIVFILLNYIKQWNPRSCLKAYHGNNLKIRLKSFYYQVKSIY